MGFALLTQGRRPCFHGRGCLLASGCMRVRRSGIRGAPLVPHNMRDRRTGQRTNEKRRAEKRGREHERRLSTVSSARAPQNRAGRSGRRARRMPAKSWSSWRSWAAPRAPRPARRHRVCENTKNQRRRRWPRGPRASSCTAARRRWFLPVSLPYFCSCFLSCSVRLLRTRTRFQGKGSSSFDGLTPSQK